MATNLNIKIISRGVRQGVQTAMVIINGETFHAAKVAKDGQYSAGRRLNKIVNGEWQRGPYREMHVFSL
jgi:hypothetical protein